MALGLGFATILATPKSVSRPAQDYIENRDRVWKEFFKSKDSDVKSDVSPLAGFYIYVSVIFFCRGFFFYVRKVRHGPQRSI